MTEKKYKGYGYHGGGRKPKTPEKRHRTNVTICGTQAEIEKLRALAKEADKSVSRYVIEWVLDPPTICEYIETETKKAMAHALDRHILTIEEIRDCVKEEQGCLSCEYMGSRLDEDKNAFVGQCKIGHPCTGYACQHYKSRYGEENIK